MEKIVGPIKGFYVACYAWPSGEPARYSSYAKICRHPPDSYWEAKCMFKVFGGEHHASAAAALAMANLAAREQIDDLPSLEVSTFGLGMPFVQRRAARPTAA